MGNVVFKLVLFSIVLNLAVGVMITAVVDENGVEIFNPDSGYTGGLVYNPAGAQDFRSEMNRTVSPTGDLEDKGNAIYRVLDMLNLGFIKRFLQTMNKYMYGIVLVLNSILGGYLNPGLNAFLFGGENLPGILKTGITVGYMIAAWRLWTGRDLTE